MDKKFFLFIALSMIILMGSQAIINVIWPPPDPPEVADVDDQPGDTDVDDQPGATDDDPAADGKADKSGVIDAGETNGDVDVPAVDPDTGVATDGDPDGAADGADDVAADAPAVPLQFVTLGSMDPASPARMLISLTNRGAAIMRLELNSPRFRDMQDPSGYLGHFAVADAPNGGCLLRIVGPGTPAAAAGLKVGDVITAVDATVIAIADDLTTALEKTRPGDKVQLTVRRAGQSVAPLTATVISRPLEIMRPELNARPKDNLQAGLHDQFSLLMTLSQIDKQQLLIDQDELEGVELRDANWEVSKQTETEVEFRRPLPQQGLTVVKRFRLAELPSDQVDNQDFKAYHLFVDVEIVNDSKEPRELAYRLDGPTGMPTEGWWFSRKISRSGGTPLRDIALHTAIDGPEMINTSVIVDNFEENENKIFGLKQSGEANPLAYLGVETQYFAAILIPDNRPKGQQRFKSYETLLVGDVPTNSAKRHLANVTCRLTSETNKIAPGASLVHSFEFFTGPKRRGLLEQYAVPEFPTVDLSELIYFGWPIWGFFAKPLSGVLHFFYGIVHNYGLAIIMLTVMVRICMFPLSRKQALNAQKMQELQPEIKRISEKYKGDMEKRSKALQDLYRKNKYNPLSGCAPLFIQLPIFIGLYRALMTDVELRQAPLISKSISWANNLAAPDMLWRWDEALGLPFLITETGFLGPYLNVLPLITVVLFVVQQKMFMPPPTDDQSAMQQKIMKYMMVFMGFLFFKVPSGLCLYFIASSLWGLGERKLLPKMQKKEEGAAPDATAAKPDKKQPAKSSSNGSGGNRSRKKKSGKK